jgi:hypothetical protein
MLLAVAHPNLFGSPNSERPGVGIGQCHPTTTRLHEFLTPRAGAGSILPSPLQVTSALQIVVRPDANWLDIVSSIV